MTNNKKVIILGGIGNGSVIAAAINDARKRGQIEWEVYGYLNDREPRGISIEGYPVLGALKDVQIFLNEEFYFINTILRIDGQKERIEMFENLCIPDSRLVTFVHPLAYVASNVSIGPGTIIMPNVSISSGTKLGKGTIVMVNAIIGHNNIIGDFCHFAAQSCIGAYLRIDNGVHIGLNASVKEDLLIGENSTLGMGAVLTKNMPANEIWIGNPAKFFRKAR